MNQGDKIELMKYTLLQLVGMLRPCDNMGIVTYSDNARVLLAPTTGSDKGTIQTEVSNLKASGLTAGGTGIKLGYKEALKKMNTESLNLVIVVTDGAFNKDSEDYKKQVKKYKKKGILMSIIGIKLKESDREKMLEVTQLSGGNLIPINKLADAELNLKREIKSKAFKTF
jgi:Ca-activated chloride channel family protein